MMKLTGEPGKISDPANVQYWEVAKKFVEVCATTAKGYAQIANVTVAEVSSLSAQELCDRYNGKPTLEQYIAAVAKEMGLPRDDEKVIDIVNQQLSGHKIYQIADWQTARKGMGIS